MKLTLPIGLTILGVMLVVAPTEAQHGYTRAEVENGARLFQASCATCHGPKGDAVRGVALLSGQYKHATSDEQLVKIIIEGIAGTSMPPNNYSALEAGMIVAYLRGIAAGDNVTVTAGDLARGKALFEGKGKCTTCHWMPDPRKRILSRCLYGVTTRWCSSTPTDRLRRTGSASSRRS